MEKVEVSSKEAKNLYLRNWRKNNKERVKKYNETYWTKKAKKMEGQACQK